MRRGPGWRGPPPKLDATKGPLNRVPWRCFYMIKDFEKDVDELQGDYSNPRKLAGIAHEFAVYINSNAGGLVNDGERHRAG